MLKDDRFDHLKGKCVFVYGTGIKAGWIVDNVDINIIGLLDNNSENMGRNIYGLNVFSLAEAVPLANAIIIAASDIYNDLIYKRILPYVDGKGIDVYHFDGTVASQKKEQGEIADPYYELTFENLRSEIDRNDVITFDLFDTLITRKLIEPADIHFAVSPTKNREYRIKRLKYEEDLGDAANMKDVFNRLSLETPEWKHLRFREEKLELALTVPRREVMQLLNYACDAGKPVYIITDTPHSETFIRRLLTHHGITGWTGLFVSSELSKTKLNMTLWEHFLEAVQVDGSILHIGDNPKTDVANPNRVGINTFFVKSPTNLLRESSFARLFDESTNLDRSIVAGHIAARVFNSPFALHDKKGAPCLSSPEDLGYVFYGPIVFAYIAWIAKQSRIHNIDTLLFCARDGYFLDRLFNLFVSKYKEYKDVKHQYFITSRLLLIKANMQNRNDLMDSVGIRYSGSLAECLRYRYDMHSTEKIGIDTNQKSDYSLLHDIISRNADSILRTMSGVRRRYLSYVSALAGDRNVAVIEPSYNGTIQHNLQKLLQRRLAGLYMNANLSASNPYFGEQDMYALFQEVGDHDASSSAIRRFTLFVENGFFVAPTGTPITVNVNGKFRYSRPGKTQKYFDVKKKLYSGVKNYFRDMFKVYDSSDDIGLEPRYIDDFVGVFCKNNDHLSHELKSTFFCDTLYEGFSDYGLFDNSGR